MNAYGHSAGENGPAMIGFAEQNVLVIEALEA